MSKRAATRARRRPILWNVGAKISPRELDKHLDRLPIRRNYMAVRISGTIQHLVPDYATAGDLFDIVPALTEAVKRAKG